MGSSVTRNQREIWYMKSGPGTKAGKSHAGGALHALAKEEVGWGGGAHREWLAAARPT